jgi:hypothetical protein
MARIEFKFDDRRLKKNIQSVNGRVNRNVAALMQYEAAYTVGWLKQNAPWSDRTSAARTGLTATAFSAGRTHEILMAYSVYYGIWLEIANSGRYAVITPALRIVGNKVMNDMKLLLNSVGGG